MSYPDWVPVAVAVVAALAASISAFLAWRKVKVQGRLLREQRRATLLPMLLEEVARADLALTELQGRLAAAAGVTGTTAQSWIQVGLAAQDTAHQIARVSRVLADTDTRSVTDDVTRRFRQYAYAATQEAKNLGIISPAQDDEIKRLESRHRFLRLPKVDWDDARYVVGNLMIQVDTFVNDLLYKDESTAEQLARKGFQDILNNSNGGAVS